MNVRALFSARMTTAIASSQCAAVCLLRGHNWCTTTAAAAAARFTFMALFTLYVADQQATDRQQLCSRWFTHLDAL